MYKALFGRQVEIKYLIVGAFNTAVGLAAFPILYFALERLNIHYMGLLIVSQIICVTSAFFTNKYLVFRTKGNHAREFIRFSSFYMTYFLINLVLTPLLVEVQGLNPVITQLAISVGVVLSSFIWHRKVTFKDAK
jgi:putative flippase GtrA